MDRRKSIKAMFAGTVTSGFMFSGCLTDKEAEVTATDISEGEIVAGGGYGRTPEELARDQRLMSETFFNDHEMATIGVLADLIIPADETSGSATDAGVPDFIEFIVKDMPWQQTPLRGGLMWLDYESNKRYEADFIKASEEQQKDILDDIAYPDEVKPQFEHGARFFSRIRNLVASGFFTSKMGIDDLGYMGNVPNVWDGVPQDVLEKHGLEYDKKILEQSIKPEERNEIANWDNYEV
ncbi:gluconate 2-dehydrogenase subunit 3 family protein [Robertkochia marina]|uniref:Gluconate 2-dehydrogenase subunit 3 family protein n=1 Tax=Robertkochia marina TaxID=1227945 RepID=A0A4S3M1S7_9FLAO|nr:gluconate 2-dehydrogenase subunit 3 family protein [Robertkochia marina]THD69052.1 gluconate 2-dehydrogenase subunit 3 family protein [Robertkochia marina]TRZ44876.1 gluconate 2-dehydrogenase subunit 3 family protein [Robertkochia marina]